MQFVNCNYTIFLKSNCFLILYILRHNYKKMNSLQDILCQNAWTLSTQKVLNQKEFYCSFEKLSKLVTKICNKNGSLYVRNLSENERKLRSCDHSDTILGQANNISK